MNVTLNELLLFASENLIWVCYTQLILQQGLPSGLQIKKKRLRFFNFSMRTSQVIRSIVLQSMYYKWLCTPSTRNRFLRTIRHVYDALHHWCRVIYKLCHKKIKWNARHHLKSEPFTEMGALIRVQSTLDSIKSQTSEFITTVQSLWRIQHMWASCFIHLIFLLEDVHTCSSWENMQLQNTSMT